MRRPDWNKSTIIGQSHTLQRFVIYCYDNLCGAFFIEEK